MFQTTKQFTMAHVNKKANLFLCFAIFEVKDWFNGLV